MHRFRITQHDTAPALRMQLVNALTGSPLDLTGADVRLLMQDELGVQVVASSAVVEDAALGKVRYDWVAQDTAVYGECFAHFEVTRGGRIETFPPASYIRVSIQPKAEV
jgi:hypothetical protein